MCKNHVKWFAALMLLWGGSCNSNSEDDNTLDPPELSPEEITDLDADELANCYIVTAPGSYKFLADNQFNLGVGLPVPPQITPVTASLLWQTVAGSITSVELIEEEDNSYVKFRVEKAEGNAVIAVLNEKNEIEWSWHIWMPLEEIYSVATDSGYEVMNLNLGAINNTPGDARCYGMLYQWGRKDPFPASPTLTGNTNTVSAPMYDIEGKRVVIMNSDWYGIENNNIAYSISHPTVCLSNNAQYSISRDWLEASLSDDSLWGNPTGYERDPQTNEYIESGKKTCYDPSPAGWRVPPCGVFRHFTTSGGYAWELTDFNIYDINNDNITDINDFEYGWWFMASNDSPLYFPAASRFDGSYAMLMGSMSGLWGNYWSNAPYPGITGGAMSALSFQVKDMYGNEMVTVSPVGGGSRADAYSIRCVKDLK